MREVSLTSQDKEQQRFVSGATGLTINKRNFPRLARRICSMGNISSARQDSGRVQAESQLAGKMFSRVIDCDILCEKAK